MMTTSFDSLAEVFCNKNRSSKVRQSALDEMFRASSSRVVEPMLRMLTEDDGIGNLQMNVARELSITRDKRAIEGMRNLFFRTMTVNTLKPDCAELAVFLARLGDGTGASEFLNLVHSPSHAERALSYLEDFLEGHVEVVTINDLQKIASLTSTVTQNVLIDLEQAATKKESVSTAKARELAQRELQRRSKRKLGETGDGTSPIFCAKQRAGE